MTGRRKLAVGNWKMHGTRDSLDEIDALVQAHSAPRARIVLCLPATLLHAASTHAAPLSVWLGGQDCHAATKGAHTGDISAGMLRDAGARYVILGHSERRENHGETSEEVRAKARTAQAEGLVTIICVGESLAQREAANTLDIIGAQMDLSVPDTSTPENLVIAYEPIWAIGTGRIPGFEQIVEVHDFMRKDLADRFGDEIAGGISLLYGGSVKPDNAATIFAAENVDGALVGGASLRAADFTPIIHALESTILPGDITG